MYMVGWPPCLPLYLREYYADEPIFADSKIVTSVYDKGFDGELDKNARTKLPLMV